MKFSETDIRQIRAKGIDEETIRRQLEHYRTGFPFIRLNRPAIAGDGILAFDGPEKKPFTSRFDLKMAGLDIVKFVPASWAASRMFRHLFEFREKYDRSPEAYRKFREDQDFNSVHTFIDRIGEFAFFDELNAVLSRNGKGIRGLVDSRDFNPVIDALLGERGLNYASLPKALLKFHRYPEGARIAMEEHLVEAARYARNRDGVARVHFTVSPEHLRRFEEAVREKKKRYEDASGVTFDIRYSVQRPSTDILAADPDNNPFRNPDGTLHFRPAGHGALLQNLMEAGEDIVFVKNIDNIVPDRLKETTFEYKRLIGGYLLWIRDRIEQFLRKAEQGILEPGDTVKMAAFAREQLQVSFPGSFAGLTETGKTGFLVKRLNRPVRVCGMVKNEGEPGGGPFWTEDPSGNITLQIVESSQIDMSDDRQKKIFSESTHFNPVDIVCSIRDYHGKKFNLPDFVDEDMGFISLKSSGGKTLKAQELPGLWNGSMAGWITVFVEVPILTFNPVKTVNDLLRKEHQ